MFIYSYINKPHYEYYVGRDSYAVFGNAEYQLLINSYEDEKYLSLNNCKYNDMIIYNVTNYKEKKNKVYFYKNDNIYAVLVLNTNTLYYYQKDSNIWFANINKMIDNKEFIILHDFSDFDVSDQQMLLSLSQDTKSN